MDALKADPLFSGFLKGAHSKGLNNGQVSWLLSQFQERMALAESQRNSLEVGEAELLKVWTAPGEMNTKLGHALRAVKSFAVDADHAQRLEAKFGNDPDYLRLMAAIGKEVQEDSPPAGLSSAETESRETLMRSPAYSDPKHPDHAVTVAKVRALYAKQFPEHR